MVLLINSSKYKIKKCNFNFSFFPTKNLFLTLELENNFNEYLQSFFKHKNKKCLLILKNEKLKINDLILEGIFYSEKNPKQIILFLKGDN